MENQDRADQAAVQVGVWATGSLGRGPEPGDARLL